MIGDKFSDIVLDEEDRAYIEARIEKYDKEVYGGTMEAHSKSVLRRQLEREVKEGIWAGRDYLDADAGEPPKGASW